MMCFQLAPLSPLLAFLSTATPSVMTWSSCLPVAPTGRSREGAREGDSYIAGVSQHFHRGRTAPVAALTTTRQPSSLAPLTASPAPGPGFAPTRIEKTPTAIASPTDGRAHDCCCGKGLPVARRAAPTARDSSTLKHMCKKIKKNIS